MIEANNRVYVARRPLAQIHLSVQKIGLKVPIGLGGGIFAQSALLLFIKSNFTVVEYKTDGNVHTGTPTNVTDKNFEYGGYTWTK